MPLLERPIGLILMALVLLIMYAGVKRFIQYYSKDHKTMVSEILDDMEKDVQ